MSVQEALSVLSTKGVEEIELRIGNVNESGKGVAQFTENPVGFFDQATTDPVVVFNLESQYVSGQYMTLQVVQNVHIEATELFVIV